MKRVLTLLLALVMALSLAGCGGESESQSSAASQSASASEPQPEESSAASSEDAQVASSGDYAAPEELVIEGDPITGDSIQDGTYEITVDSSSSMFQIAACTLTVENGEMTATMTMGGTGYLYLYLGTGEEAAAASEEDYIPYAELDSGEHTFTLPVSALNAPIDCAAYSKRKEQWYDRTLVFRADQLPAGALGEELLTTVESLNLEDGNYTVEVALEGGSGKASVQSPCNLTVENGAVTATLIWSSSNYDYMVVDGEKYEPLTLEGGSTFEIPVTVFDYPVPVSADTTAMSTPHEIDYTLRFDSATLTPAQ